MPGDPEQCRLNAARCLKLSELAKDPARRQSLAALAETWTKLAAELNPTKRFSTRFLNLNSTNRSMQCQRL